MGTKYNITRGKIILLNATMLHTHIGVYGLREYFKSILLGIVKSVRAISKMSTVSDLKTTKI